MESPIASFLTWYRSLPVPHRQDVAAFIVQFTPGFDNIEPFDNEKLVANFESRLEEYSNNKFLCIGISLTLRACIEFFIIRKKSTRERWQETKDFFESAKQHFTMEDKAFIIKSAERFLREIPFKQEQWINTCKKWETLIDNALSDESIENWWLKTYQDNE